MENEASRFEKNYFQPESEVATSISREMGSRLVKLDGRTKVRTAEAFGSIKSLLREYRGDRE